MGASLGYGCSSRNKPSDGLSCDPANDRCPTGSACWSGKCLSGACKDNNDCGLDHVCQQELFFGGSHCVQGCWSDEDCPAQTYCPYIGIFTYGPPYPRCTPGCHDSGECRSGTICVFGECTTECHRDSECPDGTACVPLGARGLKLAETSGSVGPCENIRQCESWDDCYCTTVTADSKCLAYPLDASADAANINDAGVSIDAGPGAFRDATAASD